MGTCPQHDILWDTLTVEEHLRFFAKLKNVPDEMVESEVKLAIEEVCTVHAPAAPGRSLVPCSPHRSSCKAPRSRCLVWVIGMSVLWRG